MLLARMPAPLKAGTDEPMRTPPNHGVRIDPRRIDLRSLSWNASNRSRQTATIWPRARQWQAPPARNTAFPANTSTRKRTFITTTSAIIRILDHAARPRGSSPRRAMVGARREPCLVRGRSFRFVYRSKGPECVGADASVFRSPRNWHKMIVTTAAATVTWEWPGR